MAESLEITIRSVCCTCLSIDRKLNQLCRVDNGVNNLFFLLSYKSTAYEAMFGKDVTQLFICWECIALMKRLIRFRDQACIAQSCLSDLVDGKLIVSKMKCMSKLAISDQSLCNFECVTNETSPDNFVDCGQDIDEIKIENDLDDVPLAELSDFENIYCRREIEMSNEKTDIEKRTVSNDIIKDGSNEDYYTIQMFEEEMLKSIHVRKLNGSYVKAFSKCEFCVQGFKDLDELEKHNLKLHTPKPKCVQCEICKVFVKCKSVSKHNAEHYLKYQCRLCVQVFYTSKHMKKHLETTHSIHGMSVNGLGKNKVKQKLLNSNSKTRKKENMTDKMTSQGYLCTECNKYFVNKNQRYKHIQKTHREGFACDTCGKKFPFRNTLRRHEQIHGSPLPREQCPVCGRMVRQDLARTHARIHRQREGFHCASCGKSFVSRASYENHLKYTSSHAAGDVHRYKCPKCEKVYRSPGELRDHINYIHMGRTTHKCPICDKALATRRCITRHVRRAHHGIKENARDKICQTCGKAFRDKKCLREHELIHTSERPLSCDICSRTFRQSASLYTHKRRVHHVGPKQRIIQHTEG